MPSGACTWVAVAGNVSSGVAVASTIRSTIVGRRCRHWRARACGRLGREMGGELAVGRDMALADAGALRDPLVRGVERPASSALVTIRSRQIGAAARRPGAHDHQSGDRLRAATACRRRQLAKSSRIFSRDSVRAPCRRPRRWHWRSRARRCRHGSSRDAVEAEEDGAVVAARIDALAQRHSAPGGPADSRCLPKRAAEAARAGTRHRAWPCLRSSSARRCR